MHTREEPAVREGEGEGGGKISHEPRKGGQGEGGGKISHEPLKGGQGEEPTGATDEDGAGCPGSRHMHGAALPHQHDSHLSYLEGRRQQPCAGRRQHSQQLLKRAERLPLCELDCEVWGKGGARATAVRQTKEETGAKCLGTLGSENCVSNLHIYDISTWQLLQLLRHASVHTKP